MKNLVQMLILSLSVLILSFLFSSQIIFAQSGWQWANPAPVGATCETSFFINAQTGWATGKFGTIIKTTDGGASWKRQFINRGFSIYSICFVSPLKGWASGTGGKVYVTNNGGDSWSMQTLSTSYDVRHIAFPDSLTGFAISIAALHKTTNGGANWFTLQFQNFYGLQFFNAQTGFIFRQTNFSKTTDGGSTWSTATTGWGSIATHFSFKDETFGVVAGHGFILATTNAGHNWYPAYSGNGQEQFTSIKIHPSAIGIATCYGGKIIKSYGGLSWSAANVSLGYPYNYYTSSIIDNNNAYVFGDDGAIYKAQNNAGIYTPLTIRLTSNNFTKVIFVNSQTGFASAVDGPSLKTTNSGANWIAMNRPAGYFGTIHFLNSQTGWIAGDSLKMAKTTNGGVNWTTQNLGSSMSEIVSINFLDSAFGWCYSDVNYRYKTTNGGANWTSVNPTINPKCITFVNSLTGWAIGSSEIRKTTNGGVNWIAQTNTNTNNAAMHFLNDQTGWICGGTMITKTTNGGDNWSEQTFTDKNFKTITFINSNLGLCAGANGEIYRTTNGGDNWSSQSEIYCTSLNSICMIDQNTGWIAGDRGILLKTTDGGVTAVENNSVTAPHNFSLKQNYPNPFNPSTRINYELRNTNYVSLKVFDLLGKQVAELVNEKQNAGSYAVDFNSSEFSLPSGIYFYTLNAGEFSETKKMVLVK